jgi:virulence factor Mce-like protein
MAGKRTRPFMTGAITAVALAALMVGVLISGIPAGPQLPLPWNQRVTVHIKLADADALAPHASVEIAGVKVGEVQSVAAQATYAVATVEIEQRYADIHADATVYLRAHGLFGPKYIAIVPGTASAPLVRDGGTIELDRTVQPVDLNAILQDLQAPEQQKLRTFIVEFGKAAAGKGDDVSELFAAASQLTNVLDTPVRSLDQVAPQLSDLLVKNEAFNGYFAQAPLDQLVAHSEQTLQVFAANAGHLQSLLAHANSALSQVDVALGGDGAANLSAVIAGLGRQGGTLDKVDEFTYLLGLYGASLTGRDTSDSHDLNVTAGIIGAIENVRSAFASGDACPAVTPVAGKTALDNHCLSVRAPDAVDAGGNLYFDGLQHYLRVQVANFPPSGGASALNQLPLSQICTLPVFGSTPIPCPTATSSNQAGNKALWASNLIGFGALFGA